MLDHRAVGDDDALGDADDALADDVVVAFDFLQVVAVDDLDVTADPAILVEDRALDDAPLDDDEVRDAALPIQRAIGVGLEAVGADDDGIAHGRIAADPAAD